MAEKAEWVKLSPEEVESKILELAKQGLSTEKIGLVLRDQHGIPKVKLFGKKISKVLKEKKFTANNEESRLSGKIGKLQRHHEKNKHDYPAKHSLVRNTAQLTKLQRSA